MKIENPEILIAQKAKKALEDIPEKDITSEFKSYLKGLPSDMIQNGLVQTIAFIKGKSEKKYEKLYEVLQEFFRDYFNTAKDIDLLRYLTDTLNNINSYIYYQKGMLSFSIWLKRFALAFHPD